MLNFELKPPSKDRLTDFIENFFVPVLDRLLAVYQKLAQSEQLNGTTFLGRAYRVKANIAEANIANIASRYSLVVLNQFKTLIFDEKPSRMQDVPPCNHF